MSAQPDLIHLRSKVFDTPLNIAKHKLEDIVNVLAIRANEQPSRPMMTADQVPVGVQSNVQAIAVMPIHGTLVNRGSWIGASSGLVAYEGTRRWLLQLANDDSVSAIVLDFESYGGDAAGNAALAEEIRRIDQEVKPVYALINAVCCSAAYYLASATRKIFAVEGSMIGSIGSIIVHEDQTKKDEQEGKRYTFIESGERKSELSPHKTLSAEALANLTTAVQETGNQFIQDVARNRGLEVLTVVGFKAALFFHATALAHGLVDEIQPAHVAMDLIAQEVNTMTQSSGGVVTPQGNDSPATTTVNQPAPAPAPVPANPNPVPTPASDVPPANGPVTLTMEQLTNVVSGAVDKAVGKALQQQQSLSDEINKICSVMGRPDLAGQLISSCSSVQEARVKVFDLLSQEGDAAGIDSTHSGTVQQQQDDTQSTVNFVLEAGGFAK